MKRILGCFAAARASAAWRLGTSNPSERERSIFFMIIQYQSVSIKNTLGSANAKPKMWMRVFIYLFSV
jgi:hypothetical protein